MEGVVWYLAFELEFSLDQTVRLKKEKNKQKPPQKQEAEM